MNIGVDITIIVAIAANDVIGNKGCIPWHIPEDLRRFKSLTQGGACIVGPNTYLSLPRKPLPNRVNIVISRRQEPIDGATVMTGLPEAIEFGRTQDKKIFICGGAAIYKLALPYATHLEITRVQQSPQGDALFPAVDWSLWQLVKEEPHEGFSFLSYQITT